MTPYLPTCLRCGSQLGAVALSPSTPPWLCRGCRQSWWTAELSQEARLAFRPEIGDFYPHLPVKQAVLAELQHAMQRGTSLREDQLRLVAVSVLDSLPSTIANDFAALVAAAKGPQ